MKSVNHIIVKVRDSYNNNKRGIIQNTSIETVSSINREVEVYSAPEGVVINKGNKVIIHHNILRFRNNMKGQLINSNYFLGTVNDYKLFIVPLTEVFMYKSDDSDWTALDPFCFIKPVKKENLDKVLLSEEDSFDHKGNVKHHGIIKYPNKYMEELGLKVGDKVIFSNWSEYEFEIEGELLYKMSTKDILVKI
jgi:co-chaperonin GroES (HSP10)